MRKFFFESLYQRMIERPDIVVLTGDMGYGLLDKIRETYPDRFFNVGSAEQLMIGIAAGMAMEGKTPICYSITPFLLYRPFEFIRNFMNNEKLNIKLVGGGRNKDYGYLGSTHWAEEDEEIMDVLKNINCFRPDTNAQLSSSIPYFLKPGPAYINLIK